MRLIAVTLLLALAALAFAPAPLPKPKRPAAPAASSMEGLWRRTSGDTVRITATAWTNRPEGGGPPDFTVRIDRRASPPAFDLGHGIPARPYLVGIYKVEGDVLTICYNPVERGRPTAFDGPGKGNGTEVFTRAR